MREKLVENFTTRLELVQSIEKINRRILFSAIVFKLNGYIDEKKI